jgi:hypothetical protein
MTGIAWHLFAIALRAKYDLDMAVSSIGMMQDLEVSKN